jgi:ABC-type polysaccharide/polyol phosphate transport system ATPase subunit
MTYILASLFSRISSSAGLLIFNVEKSSSDYLQLIDFSQQPLHLRQIRGMCIHGDRLYALTPSSLLIFKFSNRTKGPLFIFEKTICRPEWLLGNRQQADLHAIYISKENNHIYLSFNTQCAIDIFDLKGNFLHRKHLWDIMPEQFPLPDCIDNFPFRYGIVRHIFENKNHEILLTIAQINGTQNSAVVEFSSGKKLLDVNAEPLHSGLIKDNMLYLCAIQRGKIFGFHYPQMANASFEINAKPRVQFTPQINNSVWKNSNQNTRGIVVLKDKLFCGVCFFGKPQPGQIPPRIVEFDMQSGDQIKEHWLPSYQGFEQPHIYFMLPVSGKLKESLRLREKPAHYIGNFTTSPAWEPHEVSTELPAKSSAKDSLSSGSIQNKISATTSSATKCSIFNPQHSSPEEKPIDLSSLKTDAKYPVNNSLDTPPQYIDHYLPVHSEPATVIFENVGLCFERVARRFLSFNKNLRRKKAFWALRDVSFTVHEGETLGVIGRNGSGKSTLSLLCANVLVPDYGKVTVNGRPQLLALGVGFKIELSGRENVFISGSLLGLSKHKIESKMDEIINFSELGEYIDEPVRMYSSGMRSRLGFAVATAAQPDILILDEILAVGDKAFKDKAMKRMQEMHGLARSVIVVSHNPSQLRKLASRILWLEKGRILMLGNPDDVIKAYNDFSNNPAEWFKQNPDLARKVFQGEGHQ